MKKKTAANIVWISIATLMVFLFLRISGGQDINKSLKKDLPILGSHEVIGWCPIIGGINHEPESGVAYFVISVNGHTNDVTAHRACHFSSAAYPRYEDMIWVDESTYPPTPRVYVVMYTTKLHVHNLFYAKKEAAMVKSHLRPKLK
jgi:hypothetical protein